MELNGIKMPEPGLGYDELDIKHIKVSLIIGTIMHKVLITFTDGNSQNITIHKIGDTLVLANPRMNSYTKEKLAVLDYLTKLIFNNDNYLIVENSPEGSIKDLDRYRYRNIIANNQGEITYALATELFEEKHFQEYDVRIVSSVAKQYKFPVKELKT